MVWRSGDGGWLTLIMSMDGGLNLKCGCLDRPGHASLVRRGCSANTVLINKVTITHYLHKYFPNACSPKRFDAMILFWTGCQQEF